MAAVSWWTKIKVGAACFLAYALGAQAVHIKYKPMTGFEEKVAIRVAEIKRERHELLYGETEKKDTS